MTMDLVPGTNYYIKQKKDNFSYGIDAILLSSIVKGKGKVLDLGTGTGIIPIRLAGIRNFDKIFGVEIQEDVFNLAKENIEYNNLEEKVTIVNEDIKNLLNVFEKSSFDVIVSNPPYMKKDSAIINEEENFAISRHEVKCTFEDISYVVGKLLKPKGKFYLIHRPNRLVDIFYFMRKNNIEPKRVRMIQPNDKKAANLVLVEGIRDGNIDLIVEKPLLVYDKENKYTEEILKMYEG